MQVVSLSKDRSHRFSKQPCDSLMLLEGLGVEGDAHCGAAVKHRSRVKADPTQPNLRQVHLIQTELLSDLRAQGFRIEPGAMGENILTEGIDLLSLPRNTLLEKNGVSVHFPKLGKCTLTPFFRNTHFFSFSPLAGLYNLMVYTKDTGSSHWLIQTHS